MIAATIGLTIVNVASGAPIPARYAACARSRPPNASTITIAAAGVIASSQPERDIRTVTVCANADATPNATPAAPACSRLRGTSRRDRAAPRTSVAIAPTATRLTPRTSFGLNASRSLSTGVSRSRSARPAMVRLSPSHSVRPTFLPARAAERDRASTNVNAPSGWTTVSGPKCKAATCSPDATPVRTTAHHQRGRESIRKVPSRWATLARRSPAIRSWNTAATA